MQVFKKSNLNRGLRPQLMLFVLLLFLSFLGCKKDDDPPMKVTPDLGVVVSDLVSPITLAQPSDDTKRLFVVDQVGKIWIIDDKGQKLAQPFIDVASKMVTLNPNYDERGLLGLAFHPNYKSNGKFYLCYTAPPPDGGPTTDAGNTGLPKRWNNTTVISEFKVSADPNIADPASERKLLQEPHPQGNHNGGTIAFGPDGFLYISIGDGGNKNDLGPGHVEDWYAANAGGNAQDNDQNLMGNVLRIDVNSSGAGKNYAIPADNPFVGKAGLDEVWAYGLRNPYRFSFDMGGTGSLLLGDAGQNLYEEIDLVTKGGNYGWNVKEGTHCFNAANEKIELTTCPGVDAAGNPLIDPVIETKNFANPGGGNFVVIVAGYVYRGNVLPELKGKYVFGNYSSAGTQPQGEVYVSTPSTGTGLWTYDKIALKSFPDNLQLYVKGFGQDSGGEIYVLASSIAGPSGTTGKVLKLVAAQ
ncbi:PQQ-dependent sugar dehydrogenase [Flavitalea sp.]|nr:PQQ-dependent sugar dehydrogenase [Flavitalea sp.]